MMTVPEKAVEWAVGIANDNSHGYDQNLSNRWGPDYDCSSLVIDAYRHAGLPLSSTYTGNMKPDFLRNGFQDVTNQVNMATGAGLQPGDVLLHEEKHTAMYIGNGMVVEATGNEHGGATGGQTGDQTGREITINPYHNFGKDGWDCVLRYEGQEPAEDPDEPDIYVVKPGDCLWTIAWDHHMTSLELAKINGLDPDKFIYPGQVLRLKPETKPETPTEETGQEYTVKPGDSLWGIAQRELGNGDRYKEITEINGLDPDKYIYPGQKLKLPKVRE